MTMQRGIYSERQKNDLMGIKVNKLERQNFKRVALFVPDAFDKNFPNVRSLG